MPTASVVDGKIVNTSIGKDVKSAKESNTMDKDAFLQLLVAQMKYQDPMEPTSNTEYVAQLATFSELEQMQNMSQSTDLQRASALVGKEVYVKATGDNGVSGLKYGKVDYVVMENGKAYLAINEELHSLDDLDTIVDLDYSKAIEKAKEFVRGYNKLPRIDRLSLTDEEAVTKLQETYDKMSDYEKTFITNDMKKGLEAYAEKLKELHKNSDEGKEATKMAKEFEENLDKLPKLEELSLGDKEAVNKLSETYEKMNDFQKGYVSKEAKEKLDTYVEKLKELEKEEGENPPEA